MTQLRGSLLGNAVARREDIGLITGKDRFFDDLPFDDVAHVVFVRSDISHGEVLSVRIDIARGMPGVLGVYRAEDVKLPAFQNWVHVSREYARPPLARERVRFVGEPIAAVVAETRAQAVDAAETVEAEIRPLPPAIDPWLAGEPTAPPLFGGSTSNICFEVEHDEGTDPLDGADHVVSLTMVSQRLAGVPMENNGIVAVPHEDGRLHVWVPTQNPIVVRRELAQVLEVEPERLRVVAPSVGGGFGPKSHAYAEFFVTAKIAMLLGRPVKWVETRSENMVSLTQGRGMTLHGDLGLTGDGRIVGFDVRITADAGAYPSLGAYLVKLTQLMMPAVYDVPALRVRGRAVATNTSTTGPYRGAGRPEATQLVERLLDVAAKRLHIDPVDLRRRNYVRPAAFPFTTRTGASYDSGEYERALDVALEAADYVALRREQEARRTSGDVLQLGIGVASYVEVTAPDGTHVEYGGIEIQEDGSATVRVGTSAHGQGHVTSFSMIVSSVLGVPLERIRVLQSDTDQVPRGSGTFGSRSLQTAGSALQVSSEAVLAKAKQLMGHLLEAEPRDVVVQGEHLQVAGSPGTAMTWAELWKAAHDDVLRPPGMDPGLASELDFDAGGATFPFGTHVAVVEVDVETGRARLIRHIAVDDCGRVLNPLIVEGQQHGGIAQGVAQALYEKVVYDEDGTPLTVALPDYGVPSAADLPSFTTLSTVTPTSRNPLGAKGVGEAGTIGSTPALHNAVVDAVSHLGVLHIEMPLTPQTVWRAIQEGRRGA